MDLTVNKRKQILNYILVINLCLLVMFFISAFGLKFIKSSILEYSNISSDPFDGAVYPISYVPNWLKSKNTSKTLEFSSDDLDINEFVEIPKYNVSLLQDSSWTDKEAILARYTYPVVYMGNYKLDYEEYAWSHLAVDIRAPIGTPVLAFANWVIIKVKDTESWDGKYVVIRHDNVKVGNTIETLYSAYEHLSEITINEWEKISKWAVLWKVWMTWITTTPHLHFQIDKKEATFHPYWPYTTRQASDVWLDFFAAINAWLWKENAIEYTINPMELINNNLTISTLNAAPIEDEISSNIQNLASNEVSTDELINSWITSTWTININSTLTWVTKISGLIFNDIVKNSKLYTATEYLYNKWITKGYDDYTFRPNNTLTRQEAIIFIFKLYNIQLDSEQALPFLDIDSGSFIAPYLKKAISLGLIARNNEFRPNDIITRAEFITILIKASGNTILNTWKTWFSDIKSTDWFSPYIETFVSVFDFDTENKIFEPNNTFNRWQIAQILYSFIKEK